MSCGSPLMICCVRVAEEPKEAMILTAGGVLVLGGQRGQDGLQVGGCGDVELFGVCAWMGCEEAQVSAISPRASDWPRAVQERFTVP